MDPCTCESVGMQMKRFILQMKNLLLGGSKELLAGKDATVIACGTMVYKALAAAKELAAEGISLRVIDMYSIKPLDEAAIIRAAKETKGIVTIEDHNVIGGSGAVQSLKWLHPMRQQK